MARPKKLYEGEKQEMSEEYPLVKTLIQPIAVTPGSHARTGQQVDEVVGSWVTRGYHLVSATPIVFADEVVVIYVLEKLPA